MNRNRKIILAAAIGAVAVLIASSAVRAYISHRMGEAEQPAEVKTAEEIPVEKASRWRIPEPEGLADELRTHGWKAEAGEAVLCVRGDTLIETDGSGMHITAFTVTFEEGDSLEAMAVDATGEVREGSITLTRDADGLSVSSELFALSSTYVQSETVGKVHVQGVPELYLELVGDEKTFVRAVEEYCATWVPGALSATFFPEIVIDTDDALITATLVCDDAASTSIAVVWDGATFEVTNDAR